jgi:hypothetical protein
MAATASRNTTRSVTLTRAFAVVGQIAYKDLSSSLDCSSN